MSIRQVSRRAWVRAVASLGAVACVLGLGSVATEPAAAADDFALRDYVTGVYHSLFHRDPDPEGLAMWTAQLRNGAPRQAVANAITHSVEFRSGLVAQAYVSYLGRGPEPAGLRFWVDQMARGATIAQIDSGFISSEEYYAANGNDPVRWVRSMYRDVLGRSAADSEAQWWAARLGHNGVTRASTALGILLSTEHLSAVVDGYYRDLLGRGLDPTGQGTWVGLLQRGTHDEEIIGGIVASDEYWALVIAKAQPKPSEVRISGGAVTTAGAPVPFTATGVFDGVSLMDVTAQTTFTITGGTCAASACSAPAVGNHTVTAAWAGFTSSTSLLVEHGPATATHLQVTGLTSPGGGAIPAGASTSVTVSASDAYGNPFDVTGSMTAALDGTACAAVCGPFTVGTHTVTAASKPGAGLPAPSPATVVATNPTTAGNRVFRWDFWFETWGDTVAQRSGPVQVGTESWWTSVDARSQHALARRSDGSLWTWGTGFLLGTGATETTQTPTWVPGTGTKHAVSSIFAAPNNSFAMFEPGGLHGWGDNGSGQLGNGGPSADRDVWTPTAVPAPQGSTWQDIEGGSGYTYGLTAEGALWSWGSNGYSGVLGDPSRESGSVPVRVGTSLWKSVTAGWNTGVGVREDGTLWQWGQRLSSVSGADFGGPEQIGTATNWASVDSDDYFYSALTTTGELWLWSSVHNGGDLPNAWLPRKITSPVSWNKVVISWPYWVGLRSDSSLWVGTISGNVAPEVLAPGTTWTDVIVASGTIYALRP
ncbi:DUF4214 domain-containing protein [Cellulomonas sp.]|uniref:DUF4214 domain-containing protein n=1 Tax=Cellulomonas sp. TaxID=40001 RepID=UPI003BAC7FFB